MGGLTRHFQGVLEVKRKPKEKKKKRQKGENKEKQRGEN